MTNYVIDASVVIKWVVQEPDSEQALRLRGENLIAPELLLSECVNILWKKARRKELATTHATLAVRSLHVLDIRLIPAKSLVDRAFELSMEIGHPAYDCMYLATALEHDRPLITADRAFVRRVSEGRYRDYIRHL